MIPSLTIFMVFYCVIGPIHTFSCLNYRTDQVPAGVMLTTPVRVPCSEATGCASLIYYNITTDIWFLLASYCSNECRNESWSFFGAAQYRLGCCNLSHCPPNGDYFDDVELQHRAVMTTHEVSPSRTRATVTHTSVITPQASSDGDENPESKFNIIYIVCSVVICIEIMVFFVALLILIREIRIFLHRRKRRSTEL